MRSGPVMLAIAAAAAWFPVAVRAQRRWSDRVLTYGMTRSERAITTGFEPDLVAEIEQRTGWKIEVRPVSPGELVHVLETGEIDFASVTETRLAELSGRLSCIASRAHSHTSSGLFYNSSGQPVTSLESLRGQRVGVLRTDQSRSRLTKYPELEIIEFSSLEPALRGLADGKISTLVARKFRTIRELERLGEQNVRVAPVDLFRSRRVFVATRKNKDLIRMLDEQLAAMRSDGSLTVLENKWRLGLPEPLPWFQRHSEVIIAIGTSVLVLLVLSLYWNMALKRSVNTLALTERELVQHRDHLEALVRTRTEDLSQLNKSLQADIVRRERAEDALRRSEARYQELFDEAPDMYFAIDAEHRIQSVNRFALELLKHDAQALVGHAFSELIYEEDAPDVRRRIQIVFDGKIDLDEFTCRMQLSDGAIVWVQARIRLVSGGKPELRIIGRDITEQRNSERARRELEDKIQRAQKLESLGLLAGGIAHDFNNLLVGVLGNAGLLSINLQNDPKNQSYVREIERGAEQAAALADQMLAYSGKGGFVKRAFDVGALIRESSGTLSETLSANAKLSLEVPSEALAIEGDESQVRRVVANLITNASDALGDEGGTIAVTAGVTDADRDYLAGTCVDDELLPGKYVFVEVADRGSGMSDETKSRMFDPFFTTKAGGRGLGMAAVLGIVRGHKGAIDIASEAGRGTSVRLLFPATDRRIEEPVTGVEPYVLPRRNSGRILVVDDEAAIRTLVRNALELVGFEVLDADDGRTAVDVFRKHQAEIDLVLLDMTMPDIGGEETIRRLRAMRQDIQIIASSGFVEQEVLGRLSGAEPNAFLRKPYRAIDLVTLVHEVLSSDSDTRETAS